MADATRRGAQDAPTSAPTSRWSFRHSRPVRRRVVASRITAL